MTAASAAGLMVADTLDRQQELTVRTSLGAGRGRIIRQLSTESVLLSLAAGSTGFGLGVVGLGAFKRWAPVDLPRIAELSVDLRLVGIAVVVVLILAALIGLLPARLVSTADLQSSLKESSGFGAGRAGRRARLLLVGTQVALASTLLGVGGLLVRSWMALQAEDQGYRAEGILGFEAHVWSFFRTPADRSGFGREAPEYLATLPGVQSAAFISSLPLAPGVGNDQARVSRRGEDQNLNLQAVVGTPKAFEALEIPSVEGRVFTADDRGDTELVVVLSQAAATLLFPNRSPVGEVIEVSYSGPPVERRIVGVVGDVRYSSPAQPGIATVYLPHAQAPTGSFYIITRQPLTNEAARATVQAGMNVLVPGASIGDVANLGELYYQAGGTRRFAVLLLTSFSVIALSLTAVGLFGLLAQGVRARRQELGVRMAIGAWPAELRNMILVEGLRLTAFGLTAGIALLLVGSGLLRTVLYGVPVHDPLTLTGVAILVMVVATIASWWPALQATRVDPIQALRRE
jgi:predicted permease